MTINKQANQKWKAFYKTAIVVLIVWTFFGLLNALFEYVIHHDVEKKDQTISDCDAAPFSQHLATVRHLPYVWHKQPLITLWFDGAWKSQFNTAYPLMKNFHFLGALAVPTKYICYSEFMTWREIRALQSDDWEIDSNSVSHNCSTNYLNNIDNGRHELSDSKSILEKQGIQAEGFVVPCGYGRAYLPNLVSQSEKYYQFYRTGTRGVNFLPIEDRYNINAYVVRSTTTLQDVESWIATAKKNNAWLILVFHQISSDKNSDLSYQLSENNYQISKDKFTDILEAVKKSGVGVVLPYQVLQIKVAPKIRKFKK
ncbi:MAG: hypothetical protein NTZ67_09215 [Gammaproteobacteria bacterium]|nr:hypothetical protein [Gammaproteobacteria bacterium]